MSEAVIVVLIGSILSSPAVLFALQEMAKRRRQPTMLEQVAELRRRVEQVERRERQTLDYVERLRRHISDGNPPPPPPWPPELTDTPTA